MLGKNPFLTIGLPVKIEAVLTAESDQVRIIWVFEVESSVSIPFDLAVGPGMISFDFKHSSTVEPASWVGPGSPEVALVVKILDIVALLLNLA